MPDYYRGKICDPDAVSLDTLNKFLVDESQWEHRLKVDWEQKIKPFAIKNGAKVFGALGMFLLVAVFLKDIVVGNNFQ